MPYTLKRDPYSSHFRIFKLITNNVRRGDVLDVGCGPGFLGKMLTQGNFSLYGIDKDKDMKTLEPKLYRKIYLFTKCFQKL